MYICIWKIRNQCLRGLHHYSAWIRWTQAPPEIYLERASEIFYTLQSTVQQYVRTHLACIIPKESCPPLDIDESARCQGVMQKTLQIIHESRRSEQTKIPFNVFRDHITIHAAVTCDGSSLSFTAQHRKLKETTSEFLPLSMIWDDAENWQWCLSMCLH